MDIKRFIYDAQLKGMSDNAIKTALFNMGASAAEVNAAFPAAVAKQQEPQPQAVVQQQAKPQIVVPQEKKPETDAPRQIQPSTVPAQPAQPNIAAPQGKQPQTAVPEVVQPKAAAAQLSQAEIDFARMLEEAKAKTSAAPSPPKPQIPGPEGTK